MKPITVKSGAVTYKLDALANKCGAKYITVYMRYRSLRQRKQPITVAALTTAQKRGPRAKG